MYNNEKLKIIEQINISFNNVFDIIHNEEEFWMEKDVDKKNKKRIELINILVSIKMQWSLLKTCLDKKDMILFMKFILIDDNYDKYYSFKILQLIFIKFRGVNNEKQSKKKNFYC